MELKSSGLVAEPLYGPLSSFLVLSFNALNFPVEERCWPNHCPHKKETIEWSDWQHPLGRSGSLWGHINKVGLLLTRRPGVPIVSADRLPQPSQNLSYLELSGVHRAVRLWSKSSRFLYLHTLWPKYLALGHRESKSTSTESKSTSTVQVPPETNRRFVSPFLRICNHSVTFMVSCSTTAPASGNIDLAEVSRLWLLN